MPAFPTGYWQLHEIATEADGDQVFTKGGAMEALRERGAEGRGSAVCAGRRGLGSARL